MVHYRLGAHMFDIAQWGLGMDESGPVEIILAGYEDTKFLTYGRDWGDDRGTIQRTTDEGCEILGDKGWIEVSRGHYEASDESLYPPVIEETEGAAKPRFRIWKTLLSRYGTTPIR